MDTSRKTIETAVRKCYAAWSSTYHHDYYGPEAPYPPVHREILRDRLLSSGAANVLDAGCGSASFLRELADSGMALYGFDLTPEMVAEGRRIFESLGLPPERLWQGSVCDPGAFADPAGRMTGRFDAAVCCGVLPHVAPEDDAAVIRHLHASVQPGGLVMVEARNALFALFTLNRYSMRFFTEELIRPDELAASASDAERHALTQALNRLQNQFRMDLPPQRQGGDGAPGYDEVLSRTHNPFLLQALFAAQGFDDIRVLFYHYHCLPPLLENELPELFRRTSLAMEDPEDWRGHFMASAFIVSGIRR